ncbi:MAG: hypothetical protein IMY86_08850, partial [Chloroflexi bacterium]|nr:hypothetical protein [Chloroflexota bacterium]
LALVFLLYETLLMVDAIGCTLVRLTITHNHLLQWTTAAHTIRLFGKEMKVALMWHQMGAAPILALALALLIGMLNPAVLPIAAPLLLLWLVSPPIAYWISRPVVHKQAPLSADQREQLRRLARRTWVYFEQFVGPDDYWLPPDHFQEDPIGRVAHRTSPTNLGLLLLSTLAAYDLGYIGLTELALRLRDTFDSMGRLERYRGHFLNWYHTHTLAPLPPRYVSTVDSGNLAGCLLALKQGLLALPHEPILRWQRWQGLLDTLSILAETVEEPALSPSAGSGQAPSASLRTGPSASLRTGLSKGLEGMDLQEAGTVLGAHLAHIRQQVLALRDDPAGWPLLLTRLNDDGWQELEHLLLSLVKAGSSALDATTLRNLRFWSGQVRRQLLNMQNEQDLLLPWLGPLSQPPALFTQAQTDPAITDAWQALQDALPTTLRLDEVAEVCRAGRARLDQLQSMLSSPLPMVQEARAWCTRLTEGLYSAYMMAGSSLVGYQDMSAQSEAYFRAMDFRFLFDSQRQVFHLGYNVEAEELDSNHYDLLASEAR